MTPMAAPDLKPVLQRFDAVSKASRARAYLLIRMAADSVFNTPGTYVPKASALPGVDRAKLLAARQSPALDSAEAA